jgi:hypothetical protein
MSRTILTSSFDRPVKLQEIKDRLAQIDFRAAIGVVTKLGSRQPWLPDTEMVVSRINLINLSLFAKAVVLYCSQQGRPLNSEPGDEGDLQWLFKALNSLQWYSKEEKETNLNEAIVSSLMRQAFVRNSVGEDPVAAMARAYCMFGELLPRVNGGRVDIDRAIESMSGVSCSDLWAFTSAIYVFSLIESANEDGPWVFTADFFQDSPDRELLAVRLQSVLDRIGKTQVDIQAIALAPKYHDPALPEEYWSSEFNVLRDYPVVKLDERAYCCPYPIFAWMRGAIGFYFDLVTYHADEERKKNPRNKNPFDNVMSRVLGDVFQEYVGEHLKALVGAAESLRPEFTYMVGREEYRSPDWVFQRMPNLPVFFECKARRPSLGMQRRCNKQDRESEIKSVLSRALGQLTAFLGNVRDGRVPGFNIKADSKFLYVLVLYDLFPYHALPETREAIDTFAGQAAPEWDQFRDHVLFVPLSIQDLELSVQIELEKGVLIEDQLATYARYRSIAPKLVWRERLPHLPKHFLEFAIDEWKPQLDTPGRVIGKLWDRYTNSVYTSLYGGSLEELEAAERENWISDAAYFRWLNSSCLHGHAVEHWVDAEQEYADLVVSTGMSAQTAARLRYHHEIARRFS